jgi:hypothetical protein
MRNGPIALLVTRHGPLRPQPAQNSGQPRHQFARQERLGEVIVRAHLQPQHAVDRIAARSEHDHRRGIARSPQPAHHRQAILARHHQIEHDHVGRLALQRRVHCLAPVHRAHGIAMLRQETLQQRAQFRIVVDNKHAGRTVAHAPPCAIPAGPPPARKL